jgi:hypothetical protein
MKLRLLRHCNCMSTYQPGLLTRSLLPAAAPALRAVLKDVALSLAIAHCTPQQQVCGTGGNGVR